MLAQTFLASYAAESDLIRAIKKSLPVPNHSSHIFYVVVARINQDVAAKNYTRELVMRIRLAIKLSPYSTDIPQLIDMHNQILRHLLAPKVPVVFATITQCEKRDIPVPIIMSCARYLDKARTLQTQFKDRYFGITPLIVRGSLDVHEETYVDGVLTLPVNDTYEALPVKVFETIAFLQALTSKCGFLKIDDDNKLIPHAGTDYQKTHDSLKAGDYMGYIANRMFQDNTWHAGKCTTDIPLVYAKPFRTGWPRGPLYYLSPRAMITAATFYMRFPGYLDGQFYEDRVMGEVLYDHNIHPVSFMLEDLFGLNSEGTLRLIEHATP